MPRQGNREGEFSFEIVRHLGVYGQSSKGWTKEANVVEWNGGNKIYPIKWTQQEEGFLENGHKQKG